MASLPVSSKNYIYGTVTDETGEALVGVNIVLKSSSNFNGTVSDNDGIYKIEILKSGEYNLKASYLGYNSIDFPLEISKGSDVIQNIRLENKGVELEDFQIVAKSSHTLIKEQSYEIELISTEGLENAVTDAKNILNSVSGVHISEDGGLGSNSSFSLNGFSGNQVKFYLDGIPMDNFGSSMSLSDLPVNLIKQIEIYKGVVPVWLGNDALGGAVNIITQNNPKYLDLSYTIASFNTHRISLNAANSWKNGFIIRTNVFYNFSKNNYKVFVDRGNGDNEKKWYPRFHDAYQSATFKMEMGVTERFWADNLLFGLISTGNSKELQTGSTMAKVYGGVLSESQSLISTLRYDKNNLFLKELNLGIYSAYTQNESHSIDTLRGYTFDWSGLPVINVESNDGEIGERTFAVYNISELNSQMNLSYKIHKSGNVNFNFAFSDYSRTVSDSLNPENEYNFFPKEMSKQNLGLAYKFDKMNKWSATIFAKYYWMQAKSSKRYDQFLATERIAELLSSQNKPGYGAAFSCFVNSELQLKLSYEKALRMPVPIEMFGDGLFLNPNPDLKPESSENLNFSVDYSKNTDGNHRIKLGSSFLYRNAKDLIYTRISPGSPESSYANSLKIRFLGAEGNFQYEYRDVLHVNTNLTFQDITDRAKQVWIKKVSGDYWQDNYSYGFRLPNRPSLFGNLNAGLNFKDIVLDNSKLSLDYFLNFTEKYFLTWVEMGTNNTKYIIPRQWSQDIQMTYSLNGGKYNVSTVCTNLMNSKLYDKYYLQKPGRAFSIKLRWSL